MPTYMVVIAFRSPSSEPVAYTLTIKGGVNGASGSGANSNASSAPGTPRAGLRYGSIGAGGGGMVAPALAPGAQYYQPSPHHGYLGDALLADPTVTLITPPASNPASPSPHTPLLAPAAGRAASSASGRWNEIAVKSAGGVNRVADDEVETLDLSQYQ